MRVFLYDEDEKRNQLQIVFSCWTSEVEEHKNIGQERGRRKVSTFSDLLNDIDGCASVWSRLMEINYHVTSYDSDRTDYSFRVTDLCLHCLVALKDHWQYSVIG